MAVPKKFQTFVSSTYVDLSHYRRIAMEAVLNLKDIPAGMELFPAANENSWAVITKIIDNCDFYILILGGRYGSISDDGRSFTEREYDYAIAKGIPVLAFVRDGVEDLSPPEVDEEIELIDAIAAFRNRVRSSHNIRMWTSESEFQAALYTSYIDARESNNRPGWIRSTDVLTAEGHDELIRARSQVEELTRVLESMRRGQQVLAGSLSRGSDIFEIGWRRSAFEVIPPAAGDKMSHVKTHTTSEGIFKISWDDLFAEVGSMVISEIAETKVRQLLTRFVANQVTETPTPTTTVNTNFEIRLEDFEALKTQFMALNLITVTAKGTTVRGNKIFWAITEYGRSYLFDLKAIHRTV